MLYGSNACTAWQRITPFLNNQQFRVRLISKFGNPCRKLKYLFVKYSRVTQQKTRLENLESHHMWNQLSKILKIDWLDRIRTQKACFFFFQILQIFCFLFSQFSISFKNDFKKTHTHNSPRLKSLTYEVMYSACGILTKNIWPPCC